MNWFNPSIAHQHCRWSEYLLRLAVQVVKAIPGQWGRLRTDWSHLDHTRPHPPRFWNPLAQGAFGSSTSSATGGHGTDC